MDRLKCEIRTVCDGDRSMLFYLAEESLHPLALGAGHGERYQPHALLDLLARAEVWVAEAEGEIAGYVAIEHEADVVAVRCLCVNPAHEARGVANQLLDWVEGLAFSGRAPALTALAPASDEPSLRLYRGHGFAVNPSPAPGMVMLEKRLPGG